MAKKILIVEDDHNISELLQLYLNNEGYQTVIANDGGEGIDQFRKFRAGCRGYAVPAKRSARKSICIPVNCRYYNPSSGRCVNIL